MNGFREEQIGNQRLVLADCLEVLPTLTDGSIDLIATDPPYGISFMGKSWDKALPDPQTWRECFRVLKPGGSAVVMSGARLDCLWRMCRDLEAAGFELSQTMWVWAYRSGFPKGQNLSIAADRAAGAEREVVGVSAHSSDRTAPSWQSSEQNKGMAAGNEGQRIITAPSSPLAVALHGWFTKGKVKPAVEVIIWARKPISEKTELANMEQHGVGGVNCGACMIPKRHDDRVEYGVDGDEGEVTCGVLGERERVEYVPNEAGRFPANLLVTGAETCGVDALGEEDSRYFSVSKWAEAHGYSDDWAAAAEAGVLQVAKPSRGEKNVGCDVKHVPAFGNDKGDGLGRGISNTRQDWTHGNPHPTCKPVTLFAYLISFLTKPGAVVLDPFLGSGTTLVVCENTGRRGIGIEKDPGYFDIACRRVEAAAAQPRLEFEEKPGRARDLALPLG